MSYETRDLYHALTYTFLERVPTDFQTSMEKRCRLQYNENSPTAYTNPLMNEYVKESDPLVLA